MKSKFDKKKKEWVLWVNQAELDLLITATDSLLLKLRKTKKGRQ